MLESISSVLPLYTPLAMDTSASLTGGSDGLVEAQAAERAQGFTRDSWIFLSLAALITALRTYSRWSMVGFRRFQADDILVLLALVGTPILVCSDGREREREGGDENLE